MKRAGSKSIGWFDFVVVTYIQALSTICSAKQRARDTFI